MADERYQTPDEPVSGVEFEVWYLRVPKLSIIQRVVKGALLHLSYPTVWRQDGSLTEVETSWLVKDMLNSLSVVNWLLGSTVPVWTTPIPDNLIIANGQTVQREDYPDLWEIVPSSMRTSTELTVPDLRDRFIVGAGGDYPVLSVGGEKEHTLTSAEMPVHNHGFTQYTFGVDIESVGVPDPTGVGNPRLPESTDNAGSGQAHNNIPPYYAMVYCVIGKL